MQLRFNEFPDLNIQNIYGKIEQTVTSLVFDSRNATNYAMFFCVEGGELDGHRFIKDAIQHGACVVVGSNVTYLKWMAEQYPLTTFIQVVNPKTTMAKMAAIIYGESYKNLLTVAITGTNGKTTVAAYTRSLLNHANLPTGSIGTAGIWNHTQELNLAHSTHTTPEAPDLHRILDIFHRQDVQAAAIEVTSIAIAQQRIEDMVFDIGVHTNLEPEHLDFHPTFQAYKQAKLKLFQQVKKAVVNIDDTGMSQDILNDFEGLILTYSLQKDADVSAYPVHIGDWGTTLALYIQNESYQVDVPIFGDHNISNLLAAICVCLHARLPVCKILGAITCVKGAAGRFQVLDYLTNYKIILDYAHTPYGLQNVVQTTQKLSHRRFILMITGVGLRDPAQRSQMAEIADNQANEIVVSIDHPGFLNRQDIINDVLEGFRYTQAANIHPVLDREKAIKKALSLAGNGDIVLITGLGSGGYQVVEGKNVPYSDIEVMNRHFRNERISTEQHLF